MNCSFNIRYKPRTTRAFTKSNLTVYDSAGNTALNALTVYGKSEVVDGAIKSAGEGWSTVDLGTLTWTKTASSSPQKTNFIVPSINNAYVVSSDNEVPHFLCNKKQSQPYNETWGTDTISQKTNGVIWLTTPSTITDEMELAAWFADNPTYLAYRLADPTQGNCIAVKTDDGTGVDGTMAVFTTGTPLRGIPDTTVRDVMAWDGSAGTVTKNCNEADLGTRNWAYNDNLHCFQSGADFNFPNNALGLLPLYTLRVGIDAGLLNDKEYTLSSNGRVYIKDTDYNDATAFKTAMNGVKLVYELATPTTQPLTSTENASIAGLRTFEPQTHAQNNAGAEMTVDYTIRVPTI